MKNNSGVKHGMVQAFIWGILAVVWSGCSQQQKDKDIKSMIASNAKQEVAFAGVTYTVANGVVTLAGNCPTEKQKNEVEKTIKNTSGVKNVIDHIQIAPVILNTDFSLKQSVDSVLTKYAAAEAQVQDSVIILQGAVEKKKLQTLLQSLSALHPKAIQPQVVSQ